MACELDRKGAGRMQVGRGKTGDAADQPRPIKRIQPPDAAALAARYVVSPPLQDTTTTEESV